MDKNTATGLALIFLLMMGWFYFTMPSEEEMARQQRERATQDSLAQIEQKQQDSLQESPDVERDAPAIREERQPQRDVPQQGLFATATETEQTEFEVSTPLYTIVFTNKGAGPSSFILEQYDTWAGHPVQLINDTTRSAYNIGFLSTENYNVETQDLLFRQVTSGSSITITEGRENQVSYVLELEGDRQVEVTYTMNGDNYEIDVDLRFVNLQDYIVGRSVDFGWTTPLNFTEKDHTQDALETAAYVYAGGELEKFKLDETGRNEVNINGNIDWAATKTKFFTQLIKPLSSTDAALLTGEVTGANDDPNTRHFYTSSIRTNLENDGSASYRMYVGPMKYREIIKVDENAYDMVDVGWSWLRWFSDPFVRWMVIPFFEFMSNYVANVGVIIIIFASLVKL
ncbi:MAG: membrane protein insertase YidC, partial [Balneolaceae bacterium]